MDKSSADLLFSNSTLYYFFSTVAQVLAATSALSAIFIQIKLKDIKKFLVGTGKSMLNRISFNEEGYRELESIHKLRLRDSVDKEDLDEIEDVIKILSRKEIEKRILKNDHPKGFQGLLEKFKTQRQLIASLRDSIKAGIIYSMITIFTCIIFLTVVDFICQFNIFTILSMFIVLSLTAISFWKSIKSIYKGLGESLD